MNFRHEYKHEINYEDQLILLSRLRAVMKPDSHAVNGSYQIRSLYFDSPEDKALREKQDGVNFREKFRIRYYNDDTSYIVLEKKSKINGLSSKESCTISQEEAQKIIDKDLRWLIDSDNDLCREFYSKIYRDRLEPKTIVDYMRYPFVFSPGNVRVTIDYKIRTGSFKKAFLDPSALTLPAGDPCIVLEVKWDDYLPDIIKNIVFIPSRHTCSFSKYERCRIYG